MDTTGITFDPTTFGVNPTSLAIAAAFIILQVNAIKGLFPKIAGGATTILALGFSALYYLFMRYPTAGNFYFSIVGPFAVATGLWHTGKILIAKARGDE